MPRLYVSIFLVFYCGVISMAQNHTISGYVTDASSGETLIGANVFLTDDKGTGISTNVYGFYSISLPEGTHSITCSYLGFQNQFFEIDLSDNVKLNIKMSAGVTIDEVVVSAEKEEREANVEGTQMGTVKLPVDKIKKLPAIFGEVDILKAIQLLPGVLSAGEGTSGFYVRGGGPDQNLVLLDEAVVYNSGHLLGFFSVFNADAIKNTTLIKGAMPANYGGRLSSVLDIQMKEGNDQHFSAQGGIGLVSSRLTLEGPLVKDKSSFIISGRRTYVGDLAQPALNGSDFEGTNYYFYDLNAKLNYRISDKDRLYFSGYFGRDVLRFRFPKRDFFFDLPYGNNTATLRWNHLFSDKLFFNLSGIYNEYDFEFDGGQDNFVFNIFSGVKDWNLKADFDYYASTRHSVKFGGNYTYHTFTPNIASASNGEVEFNTDFLPKFGHEAALYLLDDFTISDRLKLHAGLRATLFTQVGPYFSERDQREYTSGEPVVTYTGLEPRLGIKYTLDENASVKAGVVRTNQYVHLVSNSASTLPTDIWVPSSELVQPQQSTQFSLGYFRNFKDDHYETSVEVYYKDLENQIDYADDYVDDLTQEVERSFVFGTGRAYGIELFFKKSTGRLNGWVGYTLSRSDRLFPDIEDGRRFPAVYDRTHDLSIVGNYQLSEKLELGGALVYGSGNYFTPVRGFFFIEQNLNLFYGPRNSERLDAYHRLDLSLTWTPNPKSTKSWKSSWTFSVYNIYNRKNPFFINYDVETDLSVGTTTIEGEKITIFPIIPSITYNFKWK